MLHFGEKKNTNVKDIQKKNAVYADFSDNLL